MPTSSTKPRAPELPAWLRSCPRCGLAADELLRRPETLRVIEQVMSAGPGGQIDGPVIDLLDNAHQGYTRARLAAQFRSGQGTVALVGRKHGTEQWRLLNDEIALPDPNIEELSFRAVANGPAPGMPGRAVHFSVTVELSNLTEDN